MDPALTPHSELEFLALGRVPRMLTRLLSTPPCVLLPPLQHPSPCWPFPGKAKVVSASCPHPQPDPGPRSHPVGPALTRTLIPLKSNLYPDLEGQAWVYCSSLALDGHQPLGSPICSPP